MLSEFISLHRVEILALTRAKVAVRTAPRATETEIEEGVPLFLDQLTAVLRAQEVRGTVSNPAVGRTAAGHGANRMRTGFTVDQLVHDYGDVCQAITELAVDWDNTIAADDFRSLNKCLDFAIAQAVTEFERQRTRQQSEQENERSGFLAHELNNLVNTAKLTFHVLKQGKVAIGGSTGAVLERTLNSISEVVNRSVAKVRVATGVFARERFLVSELMEELQVTATIEAASRGFNLEVSQLDQALEIETDRLLVVGAVVNLLRNAFKFSALGSTIGLRASKIVGDKVCIEVEDECGGLPPGDEEGLFRSFEQRSIDRSGMGLGLTVSRQNIRAVGGELRVRNLSGKGCIFSIELPLEAGPTKAEPTKPEPAKPEPTKLEPTKRERRPSH
ncbi:MAG TPA: sensor histidine kinase [Polyangia bacterium]|nr:sensor histidine kinase [Polyangia bacterium]